MLRYALRRLRALPLQLVCIALCGFALVEMLPGDPVSARADLASARRLSEGDVARLRETYGLHLPALWNGNADGAAMLTETRLGRFVSRLVRFDFGESHEGRKVSALIGDALPLTLLLGLAALLAAYAVAIPLGALLAARRGRLLDRGVSTATLLALALPAPFVAVGLVSLLGALPFELLPLRGLESQNAETLGWLARFFDRAAHLVLPIFCLSYGTAALLLRFQRAAVLESLGMEFVRAARAKGASERRVLYTHALRVSLSPALSLFAVELPWVLSGSVVVETAFDLPGMGLLISRALGLRDYPTLLGVVMTLAVAATLAALAADLLAAWADPRLRDAARANEAR